MKLSYKFFTAVLLIFTASNIFAGGGDKWYSFNEGLAKAKKENKFMLVDFYTDWCGWCKKMDADTYSNEEVLDYLDEHFVMVKLNPEKDGDVTFMGQSYPAGQFAQSAGVTGYPATGFFDDKGEFIGLQPGYIPAENFMQLLQYVVAKEYENQN